MFTLILIGVVGGLITGISPCILPMLPVIFFAGTEAATTGKKPEKKKRNMRPYAVIGGLVVSFSIFTLLGSLLISALGLPSNVLRVTGLAVLVLVGIGLIIPWVGEQLEKPFAWLPQRRRGGEGGAFVLGLGLGLLYVPCAGPVLAAITVAGATGNIGADTVALTVSFAVGAAAPLLIFALAGRKVSERVRAFRTKARGVRIAGGVVMILLAIGLVFNLPAIAQRALPDYTSGLQRKVEDSSAVRPKLAGLADAGNSKLSNCPSGATELHDNCGSAQPIEATGWFNTPNDEALPAENLRGKVQLIDFWTYSCINCQRSVPHVQEWHEKYRDSGLSVIGVHTPEFSFERDTSNVKDGAERLGITYPVAIDNNYATWTNYRNRYWPAVFLIDAKGKVRYLQLGEGNYKNTESMIRALLLEADPDVNLPAPADDDGAKLTKNRTPEIYLGHAKGETRFVEPVKPDVVHTYKSPQDQPADTVALTGAWLVGPQQATANENAALTLNYQADNVNIVLGGAGTATVTPAKGKKVTTTIQGAPRVYSVLEGRGGKRGTVTIALSPGVAAYAITFG